MIYNKISVTTADLKRSQLLKCREKYVVRINCILSEGLISYITASLVFLFFWSILHDNIVTFIKIIFENTITLK